MPEMHEYHVMTYNLYRSPAPRIVTVLAIDAVEALASVDTGMPRRCAVRMTHVASPDTWQSSHGMARRAAELAASDNAHWQRQPADGRVGAIAWRVA